MYIYQFMYIKPKKKKKSRNVCIKIDTSDQLDYLLDLCGSITTRSINGSNIFRTKGDIFRERKWSRERERREMGRNRWGLYI